MYQHNLKKRKIKTVEILCFSVPLSVTKTRNQTNYNRFMCIHIAIAYTLKHFHIIPNEIHKVNTKNGNTLKTNKEMECGGGEYGEKSDMKTKKSSFSFSLFILILSCCFRKCFMLLRICCMLSVLVWFSIEQTKYQKKDRCIYFMYFDGMYKLKVLQFFFFSSFLLPILQNPTTTTTSKKGKKKSSAKSFLQTSTIVVCFSSVIMSSIFMYVCKNVFGWLFVQHRICICMYLERISLCVDEVVRDKTKFLCIKSQWLDVLKE